MTSEPFESIVSTSLTAKEMTPGRKVAVVVPTVVVPVWVKLVV